MSTTDDFFEEDESPEEILETFDEGEKAESRPPKPSRGSSRFSWCILGDHTSCPVQVGKTRCSCTCADHGTAHETLPGVSPEFQKIIDKYYL